MNKRTLVELLILATILIVFFYKSFFFSLVPFPGDTLLSEYKPWNTYSYNGYNPGSIPSKGQYPDTVRQLYPWKTFATTLLNKATIPHWNPYNFSGTPLLANFQSAAFYPLNIFYAFTDPTFAWLLLILSQVLIALTATYYYAKSIRMGTGAAIFSAVTYAFSSFMTVWLQYNTIGQSICWLPLVLLCIELLSKKRTILLSLIYLVAVSSSALAGHPQTFGYLFLFQWIYTMVRFQNRAIRLHISILSSASIGVIAFQWLPGIELMMNSARSPHPLNILFEKILLQPWHLVMTLVPDFFGNPATRNYWPTDTYIGKVTSIGLGGLFFALFAVFKRTDQFVKIFSLAALVVLTLITINPLSYVIYHIPIPILQNSSPTLMTFLLSFAGAILAGKGMDSWREMPNKSRLTQFLLTSTVLCLFLLWIFTFLSQYITKPEWIIHIRSMQRNLLYTSGITGIFAFIILIPRYIKLHKKYIVLCILVLQCFDLWFAFQKFNSFVPTSYIFPDAPIFTSLSERGGIDRFLGIGSAAIDSNFATQYQLFSSEGYDPLYPKWYGELIHSSKDGTIQPQFTDATRSDAVFPGSNSPDSFAQNRFRTKLINLMGIRYILDRTENANTQVSFDPNVMRLISTEHDWKLFENTEALPRLFLSSKYQIYSNASDFASRFYDPGLDPKRTLLLEASPSLPITPDASGTARLITYSPNSLQIDTESSGNQLLFISDTYYPGWKATIDDKPTSILKAHYAFRAIAVPSGAHTIKMTYAGDVFWTGVLVSIVSVALVLSYMYISNRALQNV